MQNNLKLILVAPDKSLYAAFQEYFDYFPNVEVSNNYFEWLQEYDCLVSPANSFGMMDGGIDAAIAKFFGMSLEKKYSRESWKITWENNQS
jgi:hypothetical protein